MRVLFVTWDGPEVNYLESLFVPIFAGLAARGVQFDVLQFRWGDASLTRAVEKACVGQGIGYRAVEVRRKPAPLAPFASALFGARHVRAAVRAFGSTAIMPRSLMPALAVLAAGGRRLRPIIFDADGLEADERTEFRGLSASGPVYRALRAVERAMVRQSAAVLVRTPFAANVLSERSGIGSERFHVVTNGRDERLFAPGSDAERLQTRQRLGIPASAPLLVYAGSVGPQYRFDLMARYFQAIRAAMPGTRMLMLSGTPDRAREELTRHSSSVADFTSFVRSDADQVPLYLAAADAGFAFRSTSFSTRAVAPVKLGEYLLCGLPVIGTGEVGDSATASAAGLFLDERSGPDAAAEWLRDKVIANREAIRGAARQAGLDHFSLGRSIDDYTRAVQAAQV